MIVSPDKGVFFVATALMCSASLYGAELASPASDPLERIFVGVPNQLSVPPGFPQSPEPLLQAESCAPPLADAPFPQGLRTTAVVDSEKDCGSAIGKEGPALVASPGTAVAPALTPAKAAAAPSTSTAIVTD